MLFTQPLYGQNQSPDILDEGEKAAKAILAKHRNASTGRGRRPVGEAAA